MTKAIFLKDLKSKLGNTDKIEIKKESYHWGNLRIIHVGISFSVVIYPKDWQKIDNLKTGESLFFKDDQNCRWNVNFDGKNLIFTDFDTKSSTVKLAKEKLEM